MYKHIEIFTFDKTKIKYHVNLKFSLNHSIVPVIGIPEKPCLAFASKTSPTQLSGLRTNGSKIKPCSNFFTLRTSFA